MGNPASFHSNRGYARPGEIDPSDLELRPAELRPAAAPVPNRTSPTPSPVRNRTNPAPVPNLTSPTPAPNRPRAAPAPNRTAPTPVPNRVSPAPVPNRTNPMPSKGQSAINTLNRMHTTNWINAQKVSARFELLPDRKPQWGRIGLSAAAQLTALGLLLLAPLVFPQSMQTALKFDVVELMRPVTQIQIPSQTPPPPPKVRPEAPPPEPKPVEPEPEPVKLNPKQPHVFLITKPELPKVRNVEAKPLELKPVLTETKIVLEASQPARPKEEVKLSNLNSGSPAPVTVTAPLNKVQTGGFGDPDGLPGSGNPNRAANINRAGSPLLPGGPGNGNGSAGARGIRSAAAAAEDSKENGLSAGGGSARVEILNKPNPAYSDDGRAHRIEGNVVLEVVFLASGQMQVTRVVSGLGHGLDEAAILAAKQIRFRPAKRDGQPIDYPAHVRIEFRLAK